MSSPRPQPAKHSSPGETLESSITRGDDLHLPTSKDQDSSERRREDVSSLDLDQNTANLLREIENLKLQNSQLVYEKEAFRAQIEEFRRQDMEDGRLSSRSSMHEYDSKHRKASSIKRTKTQAEVEEGLRGKLVMQIGQMTKATDKIDADAAVIATLEGTISNLESQKDDLELKLARSRKKKAVVTVDDEEDSSDGEGQGSRSRRKEDQVEIDALMQVNAELVDQIYRLQVELAEAKAQVQVDEETWDWLQTARQEGLNMEQDLGEIEKSLDEQVLGGSENIDPRDAGPIPRNKKDDTQSAVTADAALNMEEPASHDEPDRPPSLQPSRRRSADDLALERFSSRSPSIRSRLSFALGENLGDFEHMLRMSATGSRPASNTWGFSRDPSLYGFSAYAPSLFNSRPPSQAGVPSRFASCHDRGTDAASRPLSYPMSRQNSSGSLELLSRSKRASRTDHANFDALLPHNKAAENPKFSPKLFSPPLAAKYEPGMDKFDFAEKVRRSSAASYDFAKDNGDKKIDEVQAQIREVHAQVRPIHRGRASSLSTIPEESEGSGASTPAFRLSHVASWSAETQSALRNAGMKDMGIQTELLAPSSKPATLAKQTQTDNAKPSSQHDLHKKRTQTEIVDLFDKSTQTTANRSNVSISAPSTSTTPLAELSAATTATGPGHPIAEKSVNTGLPSQIPRSRVTASVSLFDKGNTPSRIPRSKLAVNTSLQAQKSPAKQASASTTPMEVFTSSSHLPYARNEALTKSMQAVSSSKAKENASSPLKTVEPRADVAPKTDTESLELLPAIAYQEPEQAPSVPSLKVDAAVQTSPMETAEILVPSATATSQPSLAFPGPGSTDLSAVTYYSPEDIVYPAPEFHTDPWRYSAASASEGLEVVRAGSLSGATSGRPQDQKSAFSDRTSGQSAHFELEKSEGFARTASPSPGEQEAEEWSATGGKSPSAAVDDNATASEELVSQPSHRHESGELNEGLETVSVASTTASKPEEDSEKIVAIPTPKPASNSPVSPEHPSDHSLVAYDNQHNLPSPEPPLRIITKIAYDERVELDTVRPTEEPIGEVVLTPIGVFTPHSNAPMLVDETSAVPFPPFVDEMYQAATQRVGDVVLSPLSNRASDQFYIDLPDSASVSQRADHFRAQALAALQGHSWRNVSVEPEKVAMTRSLVVDGSSHSTGRANRPEPLRLGQRRLPLPRAEEVEVTEIGTTSPVRGQKSIDVLPEMQNCACKQKRRDTTNCACDKKRRDTTNNAIMAATLEAPPTAGLAGLLEWHKSPASPATADKGTDTPIFPGAFSPRDNAQAYNILSPGLLTLPFAQILEIRKPNFAIKTHINWKRLSWLTMWFTLLLYLTGTVWLLAVLRDQIDDWKSANVSTRKYRAVMGMRDEYWGNSWWSLIEYALNGGFHRGFLEDLGRSELFV